MENRSKAFYFLLLAAGIAGICLAAPFIRIAQGNGADGIPFTMAFWRLFTATVIIIPIGVGAAKASLNRAFSSLL